MLLVVGSTTTTIFTRHSLFSIIIDSKDELSSRDRLEIESSIDNREWSVAYCFFRHLGPSRVKLRS